MATMFTKSGRTRRPPHPSPFARLHGIGDGSLSPGIRRAAVGAVVWDIRGLGENPLQVTLDGRVALRAGVNRPFAAGGTELLALVREGLRHIRDLMAVQAHLHHVVANLRLLPPAGATKHPIAHPNSSKRHSSRRLHTMGTSRGSRWAHLETDCRNYYLSEEISTIP